MMILWAQALSIPALDKLSDRALQFSFFQGALTGGLIVLTILVALGRREK